MILKVWTKKNSENLLKIEEKWVAFEMKVYFGIIVSKVHTWVTILSQLLAQQLAVWIEGDIISYLTAAVHSTT